MKNSGIGGQAVMEGIMMRNGSQYSVAVRRTDGSIVCSHEEYHSIMEKAKILRLPFIRGTFSMIDSLVLGMKSLEWSSEQFMEDGEEEEEPSKFELWLDRMFGEKAEKIIMGVTMGIAVILAVLIFSVLPAVIAGWFGKLVSSSVLLAFIEGVIRVAIFIAYISLISLMKDIRRTYMYHGAEHKCINCVEHGMELNVQNVLRSSKEHKRCGTSFMLFVMLISILLFMVVQPETMGLRILSRILLIPVVAGISYEFLRLAGSSDSKIVNALSRPGLWLQGLTTKEPDASMAEVAIRAVEEVFDWKKYLRENFPEKYPADYGLTGEEAKAD
ncbi:MAG: DUF1385 domain-containing protein [Lachnospiraceae bacterium]